MAKYLFDCHKCTNKAHSVFYDSDYCLPAVSEGYHIELHDMGKNSLDFFTCEHYTTEPRTTAIYELVVK